MADGTAKAGTSNEGGQNPAAAGSAAKAFTQEEVNALLAKEKREQQAKYRFGAVTI